MPGLKLSLIYCLVSWDTGEMIININEQGQASQLFFFVAFLILAIVIKGRFQRSKTESIIHWTVIYAMARDSEQLPPMLEEREALLCGNACEPSSVKPPTFMCLKRN